MPDNRLMLDVFIDTSKIDKQLQTLVTKAGKTRIALDTQPIAGANSQLGTLSKLLVDIPKKMVGWMLMGNIISSVFTAITNGVQSVFALDKALTNINFTMNISNEEQEELTKNAFETADAFNTTAESVLLATQIYSNMSETIDTLNQKVETTIALANLTGDTVNATSDALQGMAFQFDIASDNVDRISDSMVAIAQTTGVNFQDSIIQMTQAVRTAGAVSADAGFSLENFLATVSTIQEVSRMSGSTIASGIVTTLSRMTRVTEDSGEAVSKLDRLLQEQNIHLTDAEGEFRNLFTVLQEISEAYDTWSSRTQQQILFELAGTRQKKTTIQILRNMDEIVNRTNIALQAEGETMQLNEIYAESLQGRIGDLNNSLEALFTSIISSDAMSDLINFARDLVDSIAIVHENFGLLNVALAITVPLFVALKGALIVKAVVSFAQSIFLLALYIKELGIVAGIATAGVSGLALAMGALTIGIGVLIGATIAHEKAERERIQALQDASVALQEQIDTSSKAEILIERLKNVALGSEEYYDITKDLNTILPEATLAIDAQSDSLERQVGIYESLNNLALEDAKLQAESVIAQSGNIDSLLKKQEGYLKKIEGFESIRRSLILKRIELEEEDQELTASQTQTLKNTNRFIEEYQQKQENLNTEIHALIKAHNLLDSRRERYNRNITTAIALEERWTKILGLRQQALEDENDIQEDTLQNFDELSSTINDITKDYEFLSDSKKVEVQNFIIGEIQKTKAFLEESKLRKEGLLEEVKFATSIAQAMFIEEQIGLTDDEIDDYTFRINKLSHELDSLFKDAPNRRNQSTAIDEAIEEQQSLLQQLETELKVLETQEQLADSVLAKNRFRENQIEILEQLRNEVEAGSLEWFQYALRIKQVGQEIEDSLNVAIEDNIKLLEDQSENLEEQADIIEDQIVNALQDEVDKLKALQDAEQARYDNLIAQKNNELDLLKEKAKMEDEQVRRAKLLSDLEKERLTLSNILNNRNVRVFREGQGFVFEADPRAVEAQQQKIIKLEEDLREHDLKKKRELEERKVQIEIAELERAQRIAKDILDSRIRDVENMMDHMTDITRLELDRQNDAWSDWLNDNKRILSQFDSKILESVRKVQQLNAERSKVIDVIDEREREPEPPRAPRRARRGDVSGTIIVSPDDPKVRNNTIHAERLSDGATGWMHINTFNDPNMAGKYRLLKTGGVIEKEGAYIGHYAEPVLNPAQTANVMSALGMQLGSQMENAKRLFAFSQNPNLSRNDTRSENIIFEIGNISMEGIQNVRGFINEMSMLRQKYLTQR